MDLLAFCKMVNFLQISILTQYIIGVFLFPVEYTNSGSNTEKSKARSMSSDSNEDPWVVSRNDTNNPLHIPLYVSDHNFTSALAGSVEGQLYDVVDSDTAQTLTGHTIYQQDVIPTTYQQQVTMNVRYICVGFYFMTFFSLYRTTCRRLGT